MPTKNNALKIGKFNKKKLDGVQYFLCKVTGKVPTKLTKKIKLALNEALDKALQPDEPEE